MNVNNFTLLEGVTPKLMSIAGTSFSIVEQVFKEMYKLELPPEIKVNRTFHVSLLKPFNKDTMWPNCKKVIRPPPNLVRGPLVYEVEGILMCRKSK